MVLDDLMHLLFLQLFELCFLVSIRSNSTLELILMNRKVYIQFFFSYLEKRTSNLSAVSELNC